WDSQKGGLVVDQASAEPAAKPARPKAARRAALPKRVAPQLATAADEAPDGDNWLHELKYDGYRIRARIERGTVALLTRSGLDWTEKFPALANALAALP